ncbi:hypothetical protein [Micromonospora sp. NPDC023633]|uniref:hypothetical protein n=1 Tax=Micromonospora sp. NPDC023633 TaxID=3154320 RepID=UPI0033E3937C
MTDLGNPRRLAAEAPPNDARDAEQVDRAVDGRHEAAQMQADLNEVMMTWHWSWQRGCPVDQSPTTTAP